MTKDELKQASVAIGSKIRALRLLKGVSQEALGKACGITFQQIQKYEKGTNRQSAARLIQIARVLEVDVCVFFDGFRQGDSEGPIGNLGEIVEQNKSLKTRMASIRRLADL